ncbi:hypothetical protein [Actinocrinis sp.]|uniref:hypothetical protein n=1 Tax=Actinocrinis sp. TaxID=1920516 RepID=UPI002CB56741|nr:hypothetical protein [Actinocrinis sp.]HXR71220.1 hypothetical protein [Actinocrinis sp.]
MRRTSFVGALIVVTLGGVFAFAIQSSPRWLDLHAAGLIMMLAGIADLVIRFVLGDSPLLGHEAADVAAVVEPLGEPVLDVFGNPITAAPPPTTLQPPPLLEVPMPYAAPSSDDPESGDGTGSSTVAGHHLATVSATAPDDTQDIPLVDGTVIRPLDPMERYSAHDREVHDQVVRQVGDYEAPSSLAPVSPLTGRPVRMLRRRRRL